MSTTATLEDGYTRTLEDLRAGRTLAAEKRARELVSAGDREYEGRVRMLLGEIATIRGQLADAIAQYRIAVELLGEHGRAGSAARALRGLAGCLQIFATPREALRTLEQARTLIDEIDDPEIRTRALLETAIREGFAHRSAGNRDLASAACREATDAAVAIQSFENTVTGRIRRTEGRALDSTAVMVGCCRQLVGMLLADEPSSLRKGVETLELAISHFRHHELRYHEARATDALAKALIESNPDQAVDRMQRALAIYRDINADFLSKRATEWIADREEVERSEGGRPIPKRTSKHLPPDATEWEGMILAGEQSIRVAETSLAFAELSAPVLITGETGTGKEVAARGIYRASARASKPFIAVNCAALAEGLIESELFGHRRGSFTGAITDKKGLFEEANGGTLFLDEIGDVSTAIQAKLLRALQEREIQPVGSGRPVAINVRLICATNRNLESMVADGSFREDLYYRIAACRLELIPLRERPEEIPILVRRFATQIGHAQGHDGAWITSDAVAMLERLPWPGNVRALRSAVEVLLGRAIRETGRPVLSVDYVREYAEKMAATTGRAAAIDADLARCGWLASDWAISQLGRPLDLAGGQLAPWVTWNSGVESAKLTMLVRALIEHDGSIKGASKRLEIHHYSLTRAAEALGVTRSSPVRASPAKADAEGAEPRHPDC